MSIKSKKYVQASVIKKINAQYIILLGGRNNGKSYAVDETCIDDAWNNNKHFAYIRRYDRDNRDTLNTEYFADKTELVKRITNNECNCITVYHKKIYFASQDMETGKIEKVRECGRCFSIAEGEHFKSLQFPNIYNIIFEEFVSESGTYLNNEVNRFQDVISSILRGREGHVYMIGNTISRICPYYSEWGLNKSVKKAVIGSIDYYNFNDGKTQLALYFTAPLDYPASMFIGNYSKTIKGESFRQDTHPHLDKPYRKYTVLYTMVFMYSPDNMFLMEFLHDEESPNIYTWYVTPKTTPIQNGTRVVSPIFNMSALWTTKFIPISDSEKKIIDFLKIKKICSSDNLTGTEFYQCLDMLH